MLRMLKHLKKGGSVGALVDLTMKPEKGAAIIRSFGMLRSVACAHCALAQRTGLPVVLVYIVSVDGGRRAIRFAEPHARQELGALGRADHGAFRAHGNE